MFTFGYKMSAAQLLPSACEPHAKFRAYPGCLSRISQTFSHSASLAAAMKS